jgi:hypothetical protein
MRERTRRLLAETKHKSMAIVGGNVVLADQGARFLSKFASIVRSEKQLHAYVIVAARIGESSEESFQRCFAIERDTSLQGRFHFGLSIHQSALRARFMINTNCRCAGLEPFTPDSFDRELGRFW